MLPDIVDHADISRMFDEILLARDIAVPLAAFDAGQPASEILEYLVRQNFDATGVREDGQLTGFALAEDLRKGGALGDHRTEFHYREIIGERTPLVDVLSLTVDRDRLYVVNRAEVTHLVTRSDLHKPPVRLLLFGYMTLLQSWPLRLVQLCYTDDSIGDVLPETRLEKARDLLRQRSADDDAGATRQVGHSRLTGGASRPAALRPSRRFPCRSTR